jgi:aryl-alcohol dehydrogenase-like predicted oxidoreductase
MRTITLGDTNLDVSVIAYGGMSLSNKVAESGAMAVARAFELGVNFFDTADVYGRGEAETVLGEALRQANIRRDQVVIASKCGIVSPGMEPAYEHKAYDLSKDYLKRSCEASLMRLGMDYLDLYQPHRIDYLTHPEETARAFEDLKTEGKIRHAGVSNHTVAEIRALSTYGRLEALQTQFSLLHIEPLETGLTTVCLEKKMSVLCWSPLHRGALAGVKAFDRDDWRKQREAGVAAQIVPFADKYGVTPSQLALAWLMNLPGGVIPLVGTASADHIAEAVAATEIQLRRDDWYELLVIARGRPMPWGQPPYTYLKER